MESIYVFLLRWDIPIFFIATISLIVGFVRLYQARYVMQRAMFSLERNYARETRINGAMLFIISAVVIATLMYVNRVVAPSLPPELLSVPTATPDPLETPFASPSPLPASTQAVLQIDRQAQDLVATATLDPIISGIPAEPVVEDGPPRPPTRAAELFIPEGGGCTPAININSPRPETYHNDTVAFFGSATNPQFAFFGLEMTGPGTGNEWINLLGGGVFEPAENDFLGSADLSQLENGRYSFRLSVFSDGAISEGSCEISLFVGVEEETEQSSGSSEP